MTCRERNGVLKKHSKHELTQRHFNSDEKRHKTKFLKLAMFPPVFSSFQIYIHVYSSALDAGTVIYL
jgi:hypothetical protein